MHFPTLSAIFIVSFLSNAVVGVPVQEVSVEVLAHSWFSDASIYLFLRRVMMSSIGV